VIWPLVSEPGSDRFSRAGEEMATEDVAMVYRPARQLPSPKRAPVAEVQRLLAVYRDRYPGLMRAISTNSRVATMGSPSATPSSRDALYPPVGLGRTEGPAMAAGIGTARCGALY
jgi:hypothetical protein